MELRLDLLRERQRSALLRFHLQRALHDLANDLHAIKLRVSFMEHVGADRASLAELVECCARADRRVTSLIEPAVQPCERARVAIRPIAEEAAEAARRAGAEVTIGPGLDALPDVQMCPTQLGVVLLSLFDNAQDAGGRVHLDGAAAGAQVRIVVGDDGPGISPEVATRIWKPFFTTRGAPHHGHGLALARHLMRAAGGAIELESGGPGARFVLTWPACERSQDGS